MNALQTVTSNLLKIGKLHSDFARGVNAQFDNTFRFC